MSSRIIHIDADCFFAAVEMRDQPELVNRPLAVGGSADGRGVISTCNYPARSFGVRSAMATAYALRLCPGLILVPHRMALYQEVSQQMMAIFREYTESIEPLSVDEAYLDVSDRCMSIDQATLVAREIRARVSRELNITVSAGVADNKFLAKVASDWNKPNGDFTVSCENRAAFVAELPVRKIPGVGKVTADHLQYLGVSQCQDLYRFSLEQLQTEFGDFGGRLYSLCRGIDTRPVVVSRERKSISVEHTFAQDLASLQECAEALPELWQRLQLRINKLSSEVSVSKGFVKIKFADFTQTTLERPGEQWPLERFEPLLKEAHARRGAAVRLLGLGVRVDSGGVRSSKEQLPLL